MQGRLSPGLFREPPTVFRMHYARIDSSGELRFHDDGTSRGFDPGPVAFTQSQFAGGFRMNLQERIGVLLSQSHAELAMLGLKLRQESSPIDQDERIFGRNLRGPYRALRGFFVVRQRIVSQLLEQIRKTSSTCRSVLRTR